MNNFLSHIFTGVDGCTYDVGRVLWALSTVVFLGLSIAKLAITHDINLLEVGGGIGTILGSGGGALWLKRQTEPS